MRKTNKVRVIEIPQIILKYWKLCRQHSDIQAIADATGLTRGVVSRAINNGRCSKPNLRLIANFFKDREETKKMISKRSLPKNKTPKSLLGTR